jgi:hypothetical protein
MTFKFVFQANKFALYNHNAKYINIIVTTTYSPSYFQNLHTYTLALQVFSNS